MFIKLHDQAGLVHLLNPKAIVDLSPAPPAQADKAKTRVLTTNFTMYAKETLGEIYTLCHDPAGWPGPLLENDCAPPYGAESLSPDWVKAVDAQIRKE